MPTNLPLQTSNEKGGKSTIELTRDLFLTVEQEFCRFLPLPPKESKCWFILWKLLYTLEEMRGLKIDLSPELKKLFVIYELGSDDSRIAKLKEIYDQEVIDETDGQVIYDLLAISPKWFTYKYYYQDEIGNWNFQEEIDYR